ncbi:protoporphyrinogen oxidase [Gracilimonas mengyeensis]|uniref:Coproporphyrinogen III oxidase n=1 Tax=Gracilimonas mengyeensis TaxID=1302730 RepID=A0A521F5R3_9BACT|nr:protoporphyrinogen oxidase [Gracilimonas mengyeensis]SMO90860.1 oxygen-dependent protoporphyrinogen oxidase [Gracilimonas mengyeensis]
MKKQEDHVEVLVLGGGISGLATAWYLQKAGISFKLIEKEAETGGVISSVRLKDTVLDFGPNSLRDRDGSIRKLAEEVGISDDIIQISEAFKTRFIVRDGKLQELIPSPKTLFTTKVLSGKAKWRLLAEPFMGKGKAGDESVGTFLERRIGREAVDYLVDPVFSGIYAGDVYRMSKNQILPKLAQNEQQFGSLLMGAFRSEKKKSEVKPMVLTFRNGIQQLTNAMEQRLGDGIAHESVTGIIKSNDGFEVQTNSGSWQAKQIVSCLPAYVLADLLSEEEEDVANQLSEIPYSPMLSTQLIFDKNDVELSASGFGFLIPRKENIRLLGAIWKSSIFPELSGEDKLHFTLMTGGAHDPQILDEPVEKVEEQVLREFKALTGIEAEPEIIKSKLWEKAIPQFEVGYQSVLDKIDEAEKDNPGLHIGGNFRWGVSVPDCVAGGRELVASMK